METDCRSDREAHVEGLLHTSIKGWLIICLVQCVTYPTLPVKRLRLGGFRLRWRLMASRLSCNVSLAIVKKICHEVVSYQAERLSCGIITLIEFLKS